MIQWMIRIWILYRGINRPWCVFTKDFCSATSFWVQSEICFPLYPRVTRSRDRKSRLVYCLPSHVSDGCVFVASTADVSTLCLRSRFSSTAFNNRHGHEAALQKSGRSFKSPMSKWEATVVKREKILSDDVKKKKKNVLRRWKTSPGWRRTVWIRIIRLPRLCTVKSNGTECVERYEQVVNHWMRLAQQLLCTNLHSESGK